MSPTPFRIIPCAEWGARPPKHPIQVAGKYDKVIFHHTAGHTTPKAIQNYHMDHNDWNDTGNNFFVNRKGFIYEGRHRSLELMLKGQCPVSAHCPFQNGNPGVEFEQLDPESLTPIQEAAGAWLMAQICKHGGFGAARIRGHRDFFATACPGTLYAKLPAFRLEVARILSPPAPRVPTRWTRIWRFWPWMTK